MAEPWFVETENGTISGPFHERQISADLISGSIADHLRVRQGSSGPWCVASRVREIFSQLSERGWYIQSEDQTYGPFTADRLLELHRAGELDDNAKLRQGLLGDWKPAGGLLAIWQSRPGQAGGESPGPTDTTPGQDRRSKWSTEPIRHVMLPLELALQPVAERCLQNERLVLRLASSNKDEEQRLSIERRNGQTVGYLNLSNSQQLLSNCQRGITHVALFSMTTSAPQIAVILCPPGTQGDDCRGYIDRYFSYAMAQTERLGAIQNDS